MTAPRDAVAVMMAPYDERFPDVPQSNRRIVEGGYRELLERLRAVGGDRIALVWTKTACETCAGVGWIVQDQTIGWPYGEQVQCSCVDGFTEAPTLHRLEQRTCEDVLVDHRPVYSTNLYRLVDEDGAPKVDGPAWAVVNPIADRLVAAVEAPVAPTERVTCEHGVTVGFVCNVCSTRAHRTVVAAAPVAPEPESEQRP